MIIWVMIGLFMLFLLFIFSKSFLYKKFGFRICSICAAVSITWIFLIILNFLGKEIDPLLIGILMGESITGVMYLFEKSVKKSGKKMLMWLKIVIILLGTTIVYLFLNENFSLRVDVLLGLIVLLFIGIYFKLNETEKYEVGLKNNKFKKEIEKLEERFEHCCD